MRDTSEQGALSSSGAPPHMRAVADNSESIGDAGVFDRDGRITVRYDDTLDDPDAPVLTSVFFEKDRPEIVVVERSGFVRSRMVFEQGSRHRVVYRTPFGSFDMTIYSRRVENALTADGGTLRLEYAVECRGAAEQKVTLTLEVERVDLSAARALRS